MQVTGKICNQSKLHVSSGYPKRKNPKSIQEMGLYNSTMAISTGFTVGLNANKYFSVSDPIIKCQSNFQERQAQPNVGDPGRFFIL